MRSTTPTGPSTCGWTWAGTPTRCRTPWCFTSAPTSSTSRAPGTSISPRAGPPSASTGTAGRQTSTTSDWNAEERVGDLARRTARAPTARCAHRPHRHASTRWRAAGLAGTKHHGRADTGSTSTSNATVAALAAATGGAPKAPQQPTPSNPRARGAGSRSGCGPSTPTATGRNRQQPRR